MLIDLCRKCHSQFFKMKKNTGLFECILNKIFQVNKDNDSRIIKYGSYMCDKLVVYFNVAEKVMDKNNRAIIHSKH